MPRTPRLIYPGLALHLVQRAVDRQPCFRNASDFGDYWRLLHTHASENACAIHSYALMTNHVHLLITPGTERSLGLMMKSVAQIYAQRFNRQCRRTGPLWESRYRINMIFDEHYLLACYRYIELNPVRAGICTSPDAYLWSSYRCNGQGVADDLVTAHPWFAAVGMDEYRQLCETALEDSELSAIREASRRGLGLGTVPTGLSPDFNVAATEKAKSGDGPVGTVPDPDRALTRRRLGR